MADKQWTVEEWKSYWQERCVRAENRIIELEAAQPSGASLRLLLDQVRRQWYGFTGYSQLKAEIDHALDCPQKHSEPQNGEAK